MREVNPSTCKVALLAGGVSGEREISLASGEGAREALEEAGFQVEFLDPAEKANLVKLLEEPYDVAFLCLHGKMGEDGTVQGLLEVAGVPYTGSGVLASALAMDKAKAKVIYRSEGIPTPDGVVLVKGGPYDAQAILDVVGCPCVVKPATEGSSIGVEIVEDPARLPGAIETAFDFDTQLVIERYVAGAEFTVAVIGNENPQALPVIQIVPRGESYDFDSKYAPGGSQHICPAPLDEETTAKLQEYAMRAHCALGCRGVSRSDFLIDEAGNPWILETNTLPGMTATSLLPDAARAAGMTFPELCTKFVEFALA